MDDSTATESDRTDDARKVKTLGTEVSEDFYTVVDDIAHECGVSKSALIRSILRGFFKEELLDADVPIDM